MDTFKAILWNGIPYGIPQQAVGRIEFQEPSYRPLEGQFDPRPMLDRFAAYDRRILALEARIAALEALNGGGK